jgi:hypothetical protein
MHTEDEWLMERFCFFPTKRTMYESEKKFQFIFNIMENENSVKDFQYLNCFPKCTSKIFPVFFT